MHAVVFIVHPRRLAAHTIKVELHDLLYHIAAQHLHNFVYVPPSSC